ECLRSLAFPEQEYRYDSIHTASNTCEWLLEDPLYQTWLANTGGLFWIKGNPGVGKSVLMKFAVETMHKRKTTEIVLSFFIHGQGTNLQKTPLGVFRALLNCLLSEFPQQLTKLSTIFEERENRFGGYAADRWGWKEEELKKILVDVLTVGLPRRAILIFVDALDECGEEPAKILLELFKEIAKQAVQGSQVKICFSSRHYPILGLDTIPTIRVEDHNDKDIQCYARERLQDIQPGLKRQQIEAEILSKARGGFQWVYLVTDIINRGILAGIRADKVLDELTSCPETLGELYATILSGIPKTEKYEMVKLFRWVLFSGRPLSAQELREALATDPKMDCKSISELRSHKSWSDTLSDFERHVKHISRGLVEFQTRDLWEQYEPDAENSDREAQFIHQSVADYLVDEFLDHSTQHESNFRSQRGAGHFQISRSCLRYLTMPEVLGGACLSPGKLFSNFPLLPYAARYLLEHIQKLEKEGFVQSDLLLAIQWAPHSDTMKRLAELWKLMDADFAHIPLGWPFIGATKLHVLVALGSKSAVDLLLECADEEVDGKDKNGNTPLMLAIRENHEDIALMLLDRFADCQPHVINEGRLIKINTQNNDDDTALNIALEEKSGAIVFKLIEVGA
ncbi:ankyrin repeat protein, partial [Phaeosphaeriaceae sp. PMI808]